MRIIWSDYTGRSATSTQKGRAVSPRIVVKYILLKKEMNARMIKAAARTKELKGKGLTLKEVQGLLVTVDIDAGFLERHYNEDVGQGMDLEFVPFKEFLTGEMEILTSAGFLYDEIASVKEVRYKGLVYDFTVEGTHNFVANGMVVSNCGVRLVRTDLTEHEVRPGYPRSYNYFVQQRTRGCRVRGCFGRGLEPNGRHPYERGRMGGR